MRGEGRSSPQAEIEALIEAILEPVALQQRQELLSIIRHGA